MIQWRGRAYSPYSTRNYIRPKYVKAIQENLSKEKKKRTMLIEKLKDVIHNKVILPNYKMMLALLKVILIISRLIFLRHSLVDTLN